MSKTKQKQILDKPRSLDDINKEYAETCGKAGQLQYKMKADEQQLGKFNQRISELATEADLRVKLDAQKNEANHAATVQLPKTVEAEVVNG